jgi:cytosine/adenosine deaminase-related metal-dependent hydrolase
LHGYLRRRHVEPEGGRHTLSRRQRRGPLEQLLPLVTANTARVLKLKGHGKLEPQMKADLLLLDRKTLELKEVIACGRRLLKTASRLARKFKIKERRFSW